MAQLIAGGGGYAATVGGTVRIFGSNDVDVISLADIVGKISFDGSFNRGGDFIILPNAAKTYSIVRAGSSVTLSDADSTITIPVGSKGATLQFADGELVLKYDGQVLLGNQAITTTSGSISAPLTPKTALPIAGSATGTLIMASDEPVTIGGNVRIFGTNGADKVSIADVPGNISFDGSFNRGGDKIILSKFAEVYTAARPNASTVTIGDNDTKLTIPLGTKGLDLQLGRDERTLIYSNNSAYLGNQIINSQISTVYSFEKNLKYIYKENAFRGSLPSFETPAPQPISTSHVVVDYDHDGLNDIIFIFYTSYPRTEGQILEGNLEAPNKIYIYKNMGGYFEDKSDEVFYGIRSVGGTPAFITVLDVNRDGTDDLIIASHQEDGVRKNPEDFFGSLTSVISSGSNYFISSFGERAWYNGATHLTSGGLDYLLFAGFGASQDLMYVYENGAFTKAENKFPPFFGNAYQQVLSKSSDYSYIIKNQAYPNLLGVEGWIQNELGEWYLADKINNPFEFVREISFLPWTSSEPSIAWVYKDGERYFLVGGGFTALRVGTIKLYPDSEPIVLMKMEVPTISDYDPSVGDISQSSSDGKYSLTANFKLIGFSMEGGKLVQHNVQIDGFNSEGVNENAGIVIKDYNKDGYDDIIIQSFSDNALPIVIINKRDGSFYASEKLKTDVEYLYFSGSTARSIFADFNGDGIEDIITFPANFTDISDPYSMNDFKLYLASASIGFG